MAQRAHNCHHAAVAFDTPTGRSNTRGELRIRCPARHPADREGVGPDGAAAPPIRPLGKLNAGQEGHIDFWSVESAASTPDHSPTKGGECLEASSCSVQAVT